MRAEWDLCCFLSRPAWRPTILWAGAFSVPSVSAGGQPRAQAEAFAYPGLKVDALPF